MSTELFYFSGTGNTLHVSKELSRRLPGSRLVPIAGLATLATIRTEAARVGVLSPLHGMTLPIPVEAFLKRLDPESADFIFAVTTRGGTRSRGFAKMQRILGSKGRQLDASFILDMPSNDPKFKEYRAPSDSELKELDDRLMRQLDEVSRAIANRESHQVSGDDGITFSRIRPIAFLLETLVGLGMAFAKYTGANKYFYADEKCKGCGTCEKVCPSGKIRLEGGGPQWQRSVPCALCYACLNFCPREAVQIRSKPYMKSYTQWNRRYPHPYATADEIAGQKGSRAIEGNGSSALYPAPRL